MFKYQHSQPALVVSLSKILNTLAHILMMSQPSMARRSREEYWQCCQVGRGGIHLSPSIIATLTGVYELMHAELNGLHEQQLENRQSADFTCLGAST